MTKHGLPSEFIENAFNSVSDECIVWPFGRTTAGYGNLTVAGKKAYAHRVICERAYGPPPSLKHEAAHNCGNGHLGCINPRHIEWKTRRENAEDTIVHGTSLRGTRRGNSKLDEGKVRRIRALLGKIPQTKIASMFGIDQSHVSHIATGITWGWLV